MCVVVEPRVERSEQIIMGTSGTMLDWVMKKKVYNAMHLLLSHHPHTVTHSLHTLLNPSLWVAGGGSQEDKDVCVGRGRCDDRPTGTARPDHPYPKVSVRCEPV